MLQLRDLHRDLPAARVAATMRWTGGERTWAWQGDVAADECTRIGAIDLEVPAAPGRVTLDLELVASGVGGDTDRVANHYASTIA